jgi:hypothetical protein
MRRGVEVLRMQRGDGAQGGAGSSAAPTQRLLYLVGNDRSKVSGKEEESNTGLVLEKTTQQVTSAAISY